MRCVCPAPKAATAAVHPDALQARGLSSSDTPGKRSEKFQDHRAGPVGAAAIDNHNATAERAHLCCHQLDHTDDVLGLIQAGDHDQGPDRGVRLLAHLQVSGSLVPCRPILRQKRTCGTNCNPRSLLASFCGRETNIVFKPGSDRQIAARIADIWRIIARRRLKIRRMPPWPGRDVSTARHTSACATRR